MSDERNRPDGKRGAMAATICAVLFAAYMLAYEATDQSVGLFIGSAPPRHFMKRTIPSISEPLFVPGDWIDEKFRQAWHLISG